MKVLFIHGNEGNSYDYYERKVKELLNPDEIEEYGLTHDCPKFIKEEETDSMDTGRIITWDEYLRNQNVENLAFEMKVFMHIFDALNSLNIDCKYTSNVYKFYGKIEF